MGLKNARRADRRKGRKSLQRDVIVEAINEEVEMQAKQDTETLKTIVVTNETLDQVKTLMLKTVSYRSKLMLDPKTDIKEWFPFIFIHSELVIFLCDVLAYSDILFRTECFSYSQIGFDFDARFPNVNSDGLLNNWITVKGRVREILEKQYKFVIKSSWPEDIEDFLALLKLMSATNRTTMAGIVGYNKAVEKLIVFQQVRNNDLVFERVFYFLTITFSLHILLFGKVGTAPKLMVSENRKHPFIIACGQSMNDITHFYFQVEKHLIPVSKHTAQHQ